MKIGILLFPELAVTGYTCGDLFFQRELQEDTHAALSRIAGATAGTDMLVCIGAPLEDRGRLYNCAVIIQDGSIIGVPCRNAISRTIGNIMKTMVYRRRNGT